jgi:hypothetical protein
MYSINSAHHCGLRPWVSPELLFQRSDRIPYCDLAMTLGMDVNRLRSRPKFTVSFECLETLLSYLSCLMFSTHQIEEMRAVILCVVEARIPLLLGGFLVLDNPHDFRRLRHDRSDLQPWSFI